MIASFASSSCLPSHFVISLMFFHSSAIMLMAFPEDVRSTMTAIWPIYHQNFKMTDDVDDCSGTIARRNVEMNGMKETFCCLYVTRM